jgi:hypothetical protein
MALMSFLATCAPILSLVGDFSIFQILGHQRDDSSLAAAVLPGVV